LVIREIIKLNWEAQKIVNMAFAKEIVDTHDINMKRVDKKSRKTFNNKIKEG